jgi:hypothetical protein
VRPNPERIEKISCSSGDRFDPEIHVTDAPFQTSRYDRLCSPESRQTLLVKTGKWWNLPGRTHLYLLGRWRSSITFAFPHQLLLKTVYFCLSDSVQFSSRFSTVKSGFLGKLSVQHRHSRQTCRKQLWLLNTQWTLESGKSTNSRQKFTSMVVQHSSDIVIDRVVKLHMEIQCRLVSSRTRGIRQVCNQRKPRQNYPL